MGAFWSKISIFPIFIVKHGQDEKKMGVRVSKFPLLSLVCVFLPLFSFSPSAF